MLIGKVNPRLGLDNVDDDDAYCSNVDARDVKLLVLVLVFVVLVLLMKVLERKTLG
ncbi:hypothetical protein HanIR_Chr16g0798031 [Helianthus annuus]|nr:hypothetical protein HanIR_Chr16g0798031 [Helianthus annuus]